MPLMAERKRHPAWVGWAVDGAPGVAFIVTYLVTLNTRSATWAIFLGSILAVAASLLVERRVRPILIVTASIAVVFGGASLLLRDFNIIKMKMTIVDGLFAMALFIGLAIGRNPLKLLLGGAFQLSDRAWGVLAVRYGVFWLLCALANEVVRRTQSDHTWVLFRTATLVVAGLFAVAQTPFLLKHNRPGQDVELPPPPDLGV